jgi:cell division protein ZapA
MKQIEVQIMGQSYLLGCPEGGEARLRDAVERVDLTMNRIRDAGKVRARDRIAVLASLHLAYDLGQQTAAAEASAAEATAATHLAAQARAELDAATASRLKADIEAAAMARARAEADARLQAEAAARAQAEAEARRAAPPPPPPPVASQDRIDDLVKRLDQALAGGPHLP